MFRPGWTPLGSAFTRSGRRIQLNSFYLFYFHLYEFHLYFALGIIALSFPVIVVSNRTYVAPAGRDQEIAPTSCSRDREIPRTGVAT